VLVRLGLDHPLRLEGHAGQWGVLLLMGSAWQFAHGRARSPGALRALDLLLMTALGGLLLVVPAGAIPEPDLRGIVVLLAVVLLVFTRSTFIPSSAPRTLAVSLVAGLPLALTSLATEPARLSVWKLVWLLAAAAVSTAGSAVIYGLRREVRHARQLGQYTLEERLGEGGMGVVWRARHAMLRRPTAVKLLRPERVGEASLRRFEREVQLTAGLSHPNTISVFDYGRTPDGVFYYAMEYLDGLTLEEVVAGDGAQPPARVAHVVRQVLGALGEAHGVGLVHRDVKPGNVILCERGGIPDVAKVLDFGLVKEAEGDPGLSHEGALVGTPLFLPPEVIRAGEAGPRSDLYSAGALAYYLLAGRCAASRRTPRGAPARRPRRWRRSRRAGSTARGRWRMRARGGPGGAARSPRNGGAVSRPARRRPRARGSRPPALPSPGSPDEGPKAQASAKTVISIVRAASPTGRCHWTRIGLWYWPRTSAGRPAAASWLARKVTRRERSRRRAGTAISFAIARSKTEWSQRRASTSELIRRGTSYFA
jgi:serine/threonine protein kinase